MNDLMPFTFAFSGTPTGLEYGCLSLCENCGWLRVANRELKEENRELRVMLARLIELHAAMEDDPSTEGTFAKMEELSIGMGVAKEMLRNTL